MDYNNVCKEDLDIINIVDGCLWWLLFSCLCSSSGHFKGGGSTTIACLMDCLRQGCRLLGIVVILW